MEEMEGIKMAKDELHKKFFISGINYKEEVRIIKK
jgi:hypothetical protein